MASGIFAILDDIAMLMDDVVMMSKLATKKTAGILGDDLAVNAEKATGFVSSRELPVLWAITKGSFINKLIILPVVFVLSYFLPILITYVLIIGGLYLAYEGVHKIYETIFHKKEHNAKDLPDYKVEITDNEKDKIKSAITTDFILSVEIVIIALGTVLDKSLMIQIMTVSIVALLATVGVYGLVALIVRLDDFGLMLIAKSKGNKAVISLGNGFVRLLPLVIRFLSVVGTIALILVAGGIFLHKIEAIHHIIPTSWPSIIAEFVVGFIGGTLAFVLITGAFALYKKLMKSEKKELDLK
jgi:predicted DNA repair protein MutK